MIKLKFLFALLMLGLCAACASTFESRMEKLGDLGDKSSVVESLGSPTLKRRRNGEDHWIYVFYSEGNKKVHEVHFQEGQMIRRSQQSLDYKRWNELDRAVNLSEWNSLTGQ